VIRILTLELRILTLDDEFDIMSIFVQALQQQGFPVIGFYATIHPMLQHFTTRPLIPIFFLGSGIAQIFWILPMIKRWGKPWYYIGIAGNIGFIILYIITRLPGNPVTGRGGTVDPVDMVCEIAQVAYIAITAIILAKERTIKVAVGRIG